MPSNIEKKNVCTQKSLNHIIDKRIEDKGTSFNENINSSNTNTVQRVDEKEDKSSLTKDSSLFCNSSKYD